jgi:hypothetical protein
MAKLWTQATSSLIQRWVDKNKARPMTDHPAFEQVVHRPFGGCPGIYLFRAPPMPFTPVLPAEVYTLRPGVMIFETMEEFRGLEEYLLTPGACFFHHPPYMRVNPPLRSQPARLAGGITEGSIYIIGTPWEGVRAFSILTAPEELLGVCSAKFRASLYRGRYATYTSPDRRTAEEHFRTVFGEKVDVRAIVTLGSPHPRAGGGQAGGHAAAGTGH